MKRKIIYVFMVFILVACCQNKYQQINWKHPITIPTSDIVYHTILNDPNNLAIGKDVLGFYNIDPGMSTKIDHELPLITPYYLNSETIVAIQKLGFPGMTHEFSGYILIFSKNNYLSCDTPDATGWDIQPYKGNVLIDSNIGINLINSTDCSLIQTVLLHDQFAGSKGKFFIGPYSLSSNGNFIIVESDKKLYNINLSNFEVFDYYKDGSYPSISPNQKQIVYTGLNDGIHLMDINGEVDRIISRFEPNTNDTYGSVRGIPPRPHWSSDGKKLIYHKCTAAGISNGCTEINDYSIYIYDFASQIESKIIDGGLNPSWR